MEPEPRFNFIDVLWSPARALSAKQIASMTIFLVVGLLVYDALYYLAAAIDGQSVSRLFDYRGFFPLHVATYSSIPAEICFGVAVAAGLLCVMLGFFAVAAINIEMMRGNRFLSTTGAVKFALKRMHQLFLSELSIALFVGFIVLLFFLLGLVSRLPFVGDWIYVLLFAIPNFIIAILSVFIIFVFLLAILLLPAVAAAERQGETFGTILETFSTIIRQPVRWFGYTFYAVAASKVCSFIYAYFAYRAVQFMVWASSLGGGADLKDLVRSGLGHLPVRTEFARAATNIFPGVDFGFSLLNQVRSSDSSVSYLMSVMLFLIFASVLGYAGAILASAQARGYVVIRRMKDNYSIPDEDPLFFTEDHVNPEYETPPGSEAEAPGEE